MITCHAVLCGIPLRESKDVPVCARNQLGDEGRALNTQPLCSILSHEAAAEILMELFVHEFCSALFICGPKRDLARMRRDAVAYF